MQSDGFLQILKDLQSPTNETRTAAEAQITQFRATKAQDLLVEFTKFITASQGTDAEKALACVLLKKYYLDDRAEEKALEQITLPQVAELKVALKNSLNFQAETLHLLRRKAEIVCKLHKREESYGELVQQIQQIASQASSSEDSVVKGKQFAMYSLELLSEFHLPQEEIVKSQENFMGLFTHSLNDSDVRVKVATLKSLTNFLTCFEEEDHVMKYKHMMGPLIDLVISVLQNNEDDGKASLTSLIELTQSYAEIWDGQVQKLIFVCSNVMKATSFDISTRQSALELVSTLSESSAKLVRAQADTLKQDFFPAIFQMLIEVEDQDDINAWAVQDEEEVHGKDNISSIAAEALERMADILGEKTMLGASTQVIVEGINKADSWQYRQAGFVFLGMISEACEKKFKKEHQDTIKLIAKGMMDEHVRVRYQALMALGLVLNVASPQVQVQFHGDLMTMFLKMLATESLIKVKSQVVSVCINFVKGLIEKNEEEEEESAKKHKDILTPYCNQLLQAIQDMLQLSIEQNYSPLQQETLGLLSTMAEVLADQFADHYTKFMPALKKILQITPAETTAQKDLRANCISAIAVILDSVKDQPELCRADALEITTALVSSLKTLEDTDPQVAAIQTAISLLAASLKDQFKPFLPELMESLFKDLKRDLDFKIVDAKEEELENAEDSEVQQIRLQIKGVEGAKTIQMNTTALENKISAIQVISQIAQAIGEHFADFIEPVAQEITKELMHDKYSSSVRKNSTKLCFVLIDCCNTNEAKVALLKLIAPHIVTEINARLPKLDFSSLKWLTKELQRSFNAVNMVRGVNFLSEDETSQLLDLCVKVLEQFQLDKEARLDQFETQKKKMDEEDQEIFRGQLEKADRVYSYAMDIAGTLLKCMPEQCSGQVQQKMIPIYMKALMNVNKKDNETAVLDALCLLCDCLEFGSDALFNDIAPQAGPKMIEILEVFGKTRFDFVQTGVFALGCLAQRKPAGQFELQQQTLATVASILNNAEFFKNEKGQVHTCLDNAVSCLGKIVYMHPVDTETVTTFLSKLPLQIDDEEAPCVHKLFFKQIQAQNPVLAQHQDAVKQALVRIAAIVEAKPDLELVDDEGKAMLNALCQQM